MKMTDNDEQKRSEKAWYIRGRAESLSYRLEAVEDKAIKCSKIPVLATATGTGRAVMGALQFTCAAFTFLAASTLLWSKRGRIVHAYSTLHMLHGLSNMVGGAIDAIPLIGQAKYVAGKGITRLIDKKYYSNDTGDNSNKPYPTMRFYSYNIPVNEIRKRRSWRNHKEGILNTLLLERHKKRDITAFKEKYERRGAWGNFRPTFFAFDPVHIMEQERHIYPDRRALPSVRRYHDWNTDPEGTEARVYAPFMLY